MQQITPLRPKLSVAGSVKTIIFDLGNVLLDITVERVVEQLKLFGVTKIHAGDIYPTNSGIFTQLELGTITEAEFVKAIQDAVSDEAPKPTHEQVITAWNSVFEPYDWKRFEMVDGLRKSGYKVIVLSNTNEPHHICFEKEFNDMNPFGRTFDSFFDAVYYSDQMQMRKPNAEIYQAVLDKEGLVASETLFVDDALVNIEGALPLGIQVYHLVKGKSVMDLFEPNV